MSLGQSSKRYTPTLRVTLNAQTDPMGSTLDHVIARGTPEFTPDLMVDRTNARHAHRTCNSTRGGGVPNSTQHDPATCATDW